MADLIQDMVRDSLTVFRNNDEVLLEQIEKREDQIDYPRNRSRDTSRNYPRVDRSIAEIEHYMINDLEHIGDIIDKSTMQL